MGFTESRSAAGNALLIRFIETLLQCAPMTLLRYCLLYVVALALAGCAPAGYPGQQGYDVQPAAVTYGGGYGNGYGGSNYDDGPIFHPTHNVTCDRSRNICHDRFGLDYFATQRYFGERAANRTVKKYGEQVFLFSPKRGVSCDRRTRACSDAGGLDVDWTEDIFGNKAEHRVRDWQSADSFQPERYVTCVAATKVCSDQKGPSITLTQVYFGRAAAQDLADELGPGAPGYMRVPEQPAANAAPVIEMPENAAPAAEIPAPDNQPDQSVPPAASAEPLPEPDPVAPPPVAEPDAEANTPPQEDNGQAAMPTQPEEAVPLTEPQGEPMAMPESSPAPVIAEPAPQPIPEPAPAPAPMADVTPVQSAPSDAGSAVSTCADPQGCPQ